MINVLLSCWTFATLPLLVLVWSGGSGGNINYAGIAWNDVLSPEAREKFVLDAPEWLRSVFGIFVPVIVEDSFFNVNWDTIVWVLNGIFNATLCCISWIPLQYLPITVLMVVLAIGLVRGVDEPQQPLEQVGEPIPAARVAPRLDAIVEIPLTVSTGLDPIFAEGNQGNTGIVGVDSGSGATTPPVCSANTRESWTDTNTRLCSTCSQELSSVSEFGATTKKQTAWGIWNGPDGKRRAVQLPAPSVEQRTELNAAYNLWRNNRTKLPVAQTTPKKAVTAKPKPNNATPNPGASAPGAIKKNAGGTGVGKQGLAKPEPRSTTNARMPREGMSNAYWETASRVLSQMGYQQHTVVDSTTKPSGSDVGAVVMLGNSGPRPIPSSSPAPIVSGNKVASFATVAATTTPIARRGQSPSPKPNYSALGNRGDSTDSNWDHPSYGGLSNPEPRFLAETTITPMRCISTTMSSPANHSRNGGIPQSFDEWHRDNARTYSSGEQSRKCSPAGSAHGEGRDNFGTTERGGRHTTGNEIVIIESSGAAGSASRFGGQFGPAISSYGIPENN